MCSITRYIKNHCGTTVLGNKKHFKLNNYGSDPKCFSYVSLGQNLVFRAVFGSVSDDKYFLAVIFKGVLDNNYFLLINFKGASNDKYFFVMQILEIK